MPTYIQLVNFTEEGTENIEEGPERLDAAKEVMRSFGGEMEAFYLTMGRYDAVVVSEFPDDESIAQGTLTYLQEGTVETETLRAFTEDEYRHLVEAATG
ncbi:GYD family protein [halophilic archaeon]|nr:GYD family protein [halophilic archaeon]